MKPQAVFTPNSEPTITYVSRAKHRLEQSLNDAFETPNMVISVSGPSKSGKTVLIRKVVSEDELIQVVSAGIKSAEDIWRRVLRWMSVSESTTTTKSTQTSYGGSLEVGGGVNVPLVAKGEGKASGRTDYVSGNTEASTVNVDPLPRVIEEIAGSTFTIFIDDFHYIEESIRDDIGKQIKAAAEAGVRIITASVPHRTDDVVRSNPELRGRVASVDIDYWSPDELIRIPRKGFKHFNAELAPTVEQRLANEAMGSPQLMQALCLNLCYVLELREPLEDQKRIDVSSEQLNDALLRTSSFTDFSKLVDKLHKGPRTRGTERKSHSFSDHTEGDVYRAILLAMCEEPVSLSFSYDDIVARVASICTGVTPVGSSVTAALEKMEAIGEEIQPTSNPIAWDGDTLDLVDPYLLFFLRSSDKLKELA